MVADLIVIWICLRVFGLFDCWLAVYEIDFVCVYDAMILALDFEVVGDEFNWSFVRGCHP